MSLPFYPQPKSKVNENERVKPTQKQMGDISPSVDAELKERSHGICELCGEEWAMERAHLTGRKQLKWKTTVTDLLHVCKKCHIWLDENPEGMKFKNLLAEIINKVLGRR